METLYARCCGLDVHKKTVVACLAVVQADGTVERTARRSGTMTANLEELATWLAEAGCTHVAMESTGVYWKPIWNVLEEAHAFELVLANARHVQAVPGRKTDLNDAAWLADLLRHGLIRGSVVPPRPQRELRELTRFRTALVEERAAHVTRLQATLEGANLKLGAVASDVTGVSARAILAALLGGESDPTVLAQGRLRDKLPALTQALTGRVTDHHRFLLPQILAMLDYLDEQIAQLSTRIAELEQPDADAAQRLDAIPGIGRRTAEIVLAELGPDLSRFPSARHLASWAGLCPGNHESGGKQRSGRIRPGNPALRRVLVEAAQALARTQTRLGARFRRLTARHGRRRAAVAVAHTLLRIIYALLTRGGSYQDLGADFYDAPDPAAIRQRCLRDLARIGFTATLTPLPA